MRCKSDQNHPNLELGKKFSGNDPFMFPYTWPTFEGILVSSLVSLYKLFVLTNWFSYWEFSFANKNSFEETNLFNSLVSSASYTKIRELYVLECFLHAIVWLACFFSVALALKLKQAQIIFFIFFLHVYVQWNKYNIFSDKLYIWIPIMTY